MRGRESHPAARRLGKGALGGRRTRPEATPLPPAKVAARRERRKVQPGAERHRGETGGNRGPAFAKGGRRRARVQAVLGAGGRAPRPASRMRDRSARLGSAGRGLHHRSRRGHAGSPPLPIVLPSPPAPLPAPGRRPRRKGSGAHLWAARAGRQPPPRARGPRAGRQGGRSRCLVGAGTRPGKGRGGRRRCRRVAARRGQERVAQAGCRAARVAGALPRRATGVAGRARSGFGAHAASGGTSRVPGAHTRRLGRAHPRAPSRRPLGLGPGRTALEAGRGRTLGAHSLGAHTRSFARRRRCPHPESPPSLAGKSSDAARLAV